MFLSSILDKSVFTKQSISKAIGKDGTGGYAIVKISPNFSNTDKVREQYMDVIGVLQDGSLPISIGADWERIGGAAALTNIPILNSLIDIGEIADALLDKANTALNPSGLVIGKAMASRKVFRGDGGYLEVSPKIRIVDWNGQGMPILAGILLVQYCLPTDATLGDDAVKFWENIKNKLANNKIIQKVFETVTDAAEGAVVLAKENPIGAGTVAVTESLTDIAKKHFDGLQTSLDLKASPPTVTVTIGEYFEHTDMVVENVELNFSKEVTPAGPLYLDATIKLSSRYIINDISNVGFKSPSKVKRVSYTGSVDLTGVE